MSVLASQLSERITIEEPIATEDGYGGQTIEWEELTTVFAEVKPLFAYYGTRRVIADRPEADPGYRVTMRLRSDVTPAMRLIWKTHTLQIHSLHETETALVILAYEERL
jgi:SPP1 family predicted phage head-tail adaptor